MKILIIEDEKELVESILQYLKQENYVCEVAFEFEQARIKISLYDYDCILLDVNLAAGNGLDLLKELKRLNKTSGVIIISAKNALDDKIKGLNLGADDYLPKPFHLAELGARIKANIRRNKFDRSDLLTFHELSVDIPGKTVRVNNRKVDLTHSEFELLLFIVSNKNKVVAKNAIAEHISGDDADVFDNYDFIYAHVKNLKKKLAEAGCADYIKTVYGLGYQFEWKP